MAAARDPGLWATGAFACRKHGPLGAARGFARLLALQPWSRRTARGARVRRAGGLPVEARVDPFGIVISSVPKPCFPSDGPAAFVGILDGPWDRYRMDLERTLLFRSLRDRFESGRPWEETGIFRVTVWAVRHGFRTWHGCRSEGDVRAVCHEVEGLYESMARHGYLARDGGIRPAAERGGEPREGEKRVGAHVVPDEIRLGVGRNGELIRLGGGRHRLGIARLLGIRSVPAVVIARHPAYRGPLPGLGSEDPERGPRPDARAEMAR